MTNKTHEALKDGEWWTLARKGNSHQCCDCGLVHTVEARWVNTPQGKQVEIRFFRNDKATKRERKKQWTAKTA